MLSEAQRHVMLHALGLDREKKSYRNGYAAEPDTPDYETWVGLETAGYAQRGRTIPGGLVPFRVTESGRRALQEEG